MGEFSLSHILIVAVIFLIFFRKDQLPGLGKSIGKAIRGFKEGLSEIEVNAKDVHDDPKQVTENKEKPISSEPKATAQKTTSPGSSSSGSDTNS